MLFNFDGEIGNFIGKITKIKLTRNKHAKITPLKPKYNLRLSYQYSQPTGLIVLLLKLIKLKLLILKIFQNNPITTINNTIVFRTLKYHIFVVLDSLSRQIRDFSYCLKILIYPHVVLRENKMMAFAGADRIQEGMRRAFGKPVGLAARVNPGQTVMEVYTNPEGVEIAKQSLRFGASKLPTPCLIQVEENK